MERVLAGHACLSYQAGVGGMDGVPALSPHSLGVLVVGSKAGRSLERTAATYLLLFPRPPPVLPNFCPCPHPPEIPPLRSWQFQSSLWHKSLLALWLDRRWKGQELRKQYRQTAANGT